MLPIALNHMTVPTLRCDGLLDLAQSLGCIGVELRNDLARPLFDGDDAETVRKAAVDRGLRVIGVSQIYPFQDWSEETERSVRTLIDQAVACGGESFTLIPRNDGRAEPEETRLADLRAALERVVPLAETAGIVALVEPLGFLSSSLRHKEEAVRVIEDLGATGRVKLVHDTFHHTLAGGGPYFVEHTGIVHVSGLTDPAPSVEEMRDDHRGLIDADDRLENIAQLKALLSQGYSGPISIEAFSPELHQLEDPEPVLRETIEFINAQVA
jgi:2-keto-myo-inositol isomerase